jgi:hypothetical protein
VFLKVDDVELQLQRSFSCVLVNYDNVEVRLLLHFLVFS